MKSIKKILIKSVVLSLLICALYGKTSDVTLGFNFMLGGRYDNLRMCVASPAGAKGGPIADVMFNIRTHFENGTSLGLKLPVMRPILFAAAFSMLQFEPEFTLEFRKEYKTGTAFVFGPGLGISLHFGPDYKTEKTASDPVSFSAGGPFFSFLSGIQKERTSGHRQIFGIRTFYAPLFTDERSPGTVFGGAFEGHFLF